jgi:hypothetical protein
MSEMTYELLKSKIDNSFSPDIDLSKDLTVYASYTDFGATEFLNVYFGYDYTNSTWNYDVYTLTTELNSEELLFLSINNGIVVKTPDEINKDLVEIGALKDE